MQVLIKNGKIEEKLHYPFKNLNQVLKSRKHRENQFRISLKLEIWKILEQV